MRENLASCDALKVNVLVGDGEALPRRHARPVRRAGARQLHRAGRDELGCGEDVIKRDLGRVLLKLEALQDERDHAGARSAKRRGAGD